MAGEYNVVLTQIAMYLGRIAASLDALAKVARAENPEVFKEPARRPHGFPAGR